MRKEIYQKNQIHNLKMVCGENSSSERCRVFFEYESKTVFLGEVSNKNAATQLIEDINE
jgi:hypothetical protein